MKNYNDTICAISTAPGESGIGIVRLSGKNALTIADTMFSSKDGKRPSKMPGYTVGYGHIIKNQKPKTKIQNCEVVDEVLLTVMRAPKSYTKEDVVEINAHGGAACLRKILALAISYGARIAEPGEFTKRAFLNGRIDLAQAEAVLDIITAKTEKSLNAAERQLTGELSKIIKNIKDVLLAIQVNIEAGLDFPDEEIQVLDDAKILTKLNRCISQLEFLLKDFQNGEVLRQGITAVICGKANVGKSTLMNRLLKQERVIVTPIPGTTRDAIEETINVKGIPIRIVDTAGIMQPLDAISREGVLKSKKYIESADLILLVFDSSQHLAKEDIDIINVVKKKEILIVVNKVDLRLRIEIGRIKKYLPKAKIIRISAKKGKNISSLYAAIQDMVWSGKVSASYEPLLTNTRHEQAIRETLKFLESAKSGLDTAQKELLAQNLKEAQNKLSVITGEAYAEDLLDEIFSRFCIGK